MSPQKKESERHDKVRQEASITAGAMVEGLACTIKSRSVKFIVSEDLMDKKKD